MTPRPDAAPAPGSGAPRVVGVKRLVTYIRGKLESDPNLRRVCVRGEVSNYSVPRSGHVNFDLKEGDAVVRAFAWASDAATFPPLRDGIKIVATGSITTYQPKSTYQLLVRSLELEGVGDLHAQFEERKRRLDAEGLFASERKRPLPRFPFRVALVSSRTSEGAIDFVTILRERAPHVKVVWCETSVQGPSAPTEICGALRRASASDVDCIVVTRGGGAFEDLFAFSDEAVVRAIARARHPVLSAIGHTTDRQLCDFAADAYVETPSAAAKAIGFETRELRGRTNDAMLRLRRDSRRSLERLETRLHAATLRSRLADDRTFLAPLAQRIDALDTRLERVVNAGSSARARTVRDLLRRLEACDPSRRLARRALEVHALATRLDAAAQRRVTASAERSRQAATRLESLTQALLDRRLRTLELVRVRLDGNSPEKLLQQGYAIVSYGDAILRDATHVKAGAVIRAQLARGTLSARVEERGEGSEGKDT